MGRTTSVVAGCLTTLLLAGCTSSGPDPKGPTEPTPGLSSDSSTATDGSTGAEATRDLWNDTRFDRLPEGDFDDLALLKEKRSGRLDDYRNLYGYAAPVFGDDVIVLLPMTQLLTVLDRDTAEVLWQERLPQLKEYPRAPKEPQQLCRVAQLPPGATVLTVLLGRNCSTFLHYDLETGELLGQERRLDDYKLSDFTATFSVARETYWLDTEARLYRFDEEGESQQLLTGSDFDLDPDKEAALDAVVINGTGVAVVRIIRYGKDAPNSDRYVGVEVTADGQAEVLWSQEARRALEQAKPRGPYSKQDANFLPELGGQLTNSVQRDVLTPRLNRFDPETGALDAGIILPKNPSGGFPGWATATGLDNLLPLSDGMLAASRFDGTERSRDATLYDFSTGQIAWTYRPKRLGEDFGIVRADPVGVSSDGAYYYVAVQGDLETLLVELDATTGKETRRWEFTLRVTSYLNNFYGLGLEVVIDGDRMVWLARSPEPDDEAFAAVFALPEEG